MGPYATWARRWARRQYVTLSTHSHPQHLYGMFYQKFLTGYRGKVLTKVLSLNQLVTDILNIFIYIFFRRSLSPLLSI
jgi:hypothetical protein